MILADTNRDGIVDDSDVTDRALWTSSRGAIFLPNVDDSPNRCPNQDLQGNPLSNHELASCHDASGPLLIEPSLVAPLKTIPLEVTNDTIAHIYATPDAASERSVRTAGRQFFEQLRRKGVGGFQPEGGRGGYGDQEIKAYGNLETIPPYTSKSGVKYPAGRIINGKNYDKMPAEATIAFLGGQELQKPLFLESGWLIIGHVDEFVQFLPCNETGLGFTIGIADTTSALDLLRNTSAAGYGGVRAISFNGSIEGAFSITEEELTMTIDELLANETFHEVNAYAQRHIDANLGILLAEIPILRDHVIRIPSLFKTPNVTSISSFTETIMKDEYLLGSFNPAALNGVVLDNYYASPQPWGPLVEGKDIFEVAVREAYAKASMEVGFVDDFMSHHHTFGEVHCGSNTFRETNVAWWK
ncbi:Protein-arginine deiminase type-1 [Colletotrichum viniferum]|nr:Protein-arginine deiminase type-1 [Colletotrichum viniferum]